MRNTSVERVMTAGPAFVSPETSATEARELFELGDLHHLPVVDNHRLVGIVSSADLLKLFLLDDPEHPPEGVTVASLMARNPRTLPRTATLRDAAEALTGGGFHALPVVDEDGKLEGIVTSSDLGLYLLHHLPRGDGSLRGDGEGSEAMGSGALTDAEFVDGLSALKSVSDDDPVGRLAKGLLAERRPLERVRKAAEHYFRSGMAEREHAVLDKALADARYVTKSVQI